jgi:hypothetical protein
MENVQDLQPATFESVLATLKEIGRLMEQSHIEAEKSRIEAEKSRIEASKRMKKLEEITGAWANNHGAFAEEYFFNSFENGQKNFFGEKFDEIRKNVKGIEKDDEYDILLINGQSIGIVEIKFKAHENDIPKVIKKVETFRENFPKYKNHRIYLGLASLTFYPESEQECINQGVAVIKQLGDTVVINDTYLKAF